jgi:hypothetical protein
VPIKTRFIFSRLADDKLVTSSIILKNYSKLIDSNISKLEEEIKTHLIENDRYSKGFRPSKTAQNSLNFITHEDESQLLSLPPLEDICDIVRSINILIKNNDSVAKDQLVNNLITQALPRLNVNNLSIVSFI